VIELNMKDSALGDSDSTLDELEQVEVLVKFAMSQVLSQLTDWTGAVHTSAAALATTMQVKSFTDAEIVEVGEQFNIAGHRTTYMVTTELTLATQASTGSALIFYPVLEAAASADVVITFVKSTLRPQHERILRDLVAGEAVISKSSQPLQEIVNAIAVLGEAANSIEAMTERINQAVEDVSAGKTEADKAVALITTSANAEILLINPQIDQAVADLVTGRALINLVNKGGASVPGNFAGYANAEVNAGQGYLTAARGYIDQAQADEQLASNYMALASHELSSAVQYFNQGVGYLRKINTAISLAAASRTAQEWGERKIAHAERELQQLAHPRTSKTLPKGAVSV